jgi:hypothetical protein
VNRRTNVGAVTAGFLGGLVLGALAWSTQIQRSRRELFSKNPMKRLAALGYLGGRPGLDTVHILGDYVRWERHPTLRRRGERILRRVRSHLD